MDLIFDASWDPNCIKRYRPDVVLSIGESHHEIWKCFQTARDLRIPTLTIQDGIPEWRDIWENPKYGCGGGQLNRQLFSADKIACHGRMHEWLLGRWGMTHKVEVVGIPWFDKYLPARNFMPRDSQKRRVIIMTANTPAFNSEQLESVMRSLLDLRTALAESDNWIPIWRLRGKVATEMATEQDRRPLAELLAEADAVITTPSTVQVEAMLHGVPTALLDYANTPHYLQAAWTITCRDHIRSTLKLMEMPAQNRLLFQDAVLHEYLECESPATPRLLSLVHRMSNFGRAARENQAPLIMPCNLLDTQSGRIPSVYWDVGRLYPEHPVYATTDLIAVQQELVNVKQENDELRRELRARRIGSWIAAAGRYVARHLRETR